jgi:D-alanyl-D-alanine carboxypeptidase/D-alanyl-D-alanine-endopeptidase (penicillin-binding protein 4)
VRTSRAAALAAGIILTAAAATGYVVHQRDHGTPQPVTTPSASSLSPTPAPREPVLAQLDAAAVAPTADGVGQQLASPAKAVVRNARLVGEVIDARTGTPLWQRGQDQPQPPASTTKLLTAAATLLTLGPDARLATTTRRAGHTVYLVGGGDPTLVRSAASYVSPTYPRPASMSELARQTVAALGHTKRVRLRLDTSAWSGPRAAPGWKPSYVTEGDVTPPSALELDEGRTDPTNPLAPRTKRPAAQAGAVFAELLRADGVHVTGRLGTGTAPQGSSQLAAVSSPPMSQLVLRMLTVSDDDLAEALGRAVAIHQHVAPTFAGAGRAVASVVAAQAHAPVRRVSLADTSGLSHQDRVTPQALVAVLRAATEPGYPQLRPLLAGLPIAGLTGTLDDRYVTGPAAKAAGVLRAKTGTLTGVNALAGLLVDRSGRLLIFGFLASGAHFPEQTVPALDRLAASLERCGCS